MSRVGVWALLAVLAGGCGGAGFHMRAATDAITFGAPPEGRAQVVFVVPGRSRDVVSIVDQRGTYYGQLRGQTVLVRDVAPGRYRFYAIRSVNGYVVDVPSIAAGQTAYIGGVDPVFTSFVWRSMTGCDDASRQARAALASLARIEPDPAVSHDTILAQLGDIPRRTGEADRDLDAMSESDRMLHTVDAASLERAGDCDRAAAVTEPATATEAEPAPSSTEPPVTP